MLKKQMARLARKKRITKALVNSDLPRLSIYRSNANIYAQIIDSSKGVTLVATSDLKISEGTKTERAKQVGKEIANLAKKEGIERVVFDRNGFLFHGRVKTLAESARENGLIF